MGPGGGVPGGGGSPLNATAVQSHDTWGRRLLCASCGRKLRHPSVGRPRVACARPECQLQRQRQLRAGQRSRWTAEDLTEALAKWGWRCAICGKESGYVRADLHQPLPAHRECLRRKPIPLRAQAWLERCVPGCPLPRP